MLHRRTLAVAALALVLAFAFLGARGIWDPDEGRYTNVAINMLESGNWLEPMRNDDVGHWTKPPLTYWAVGASLSAFGLTPFGARVPIALAYVLCALLAGQVARRLFPGTGHVASIAFLTMLLPFGASQLVTTDFLLALFEAAALAAYVEARFGPAPDRYLGRVPLARRSAWLAAMWAAFGLAFLTKGPPALLPLLAVAAFEMLVPASRIALRWWGFVVFALFALPWFVAVVADRPELAAYFVGSEVVERVASDRFGRHGEWYGWLQIYGPTLLLGTLPWTATLWRGARALPARIASWREARRREADAAVVLVTLAILAPLAIFCLARSRLPLYLLPLFVPIAVAIAALRARERRASPAWHRVGAWVGIMLGLKLAAAAWVTHKDASTWADAISARFPEGVHEVVFVEDMARYGLRLHLDAEIEKISLAPIAGTAFNPEFDEDLVTELDESRTERGVVFVAREDQLARIRARMRALGFDAALRGAPYGGRVFFAPVAFPRP